MLAANRRRGVIHTIVLLILTAVVGYLLYTLFHMKGNDYSALANRMARKTRDNFEVLRPCPLCGSMLRRGETVHTVVYSGSGRGPTRADQQHRGGEDDEGDHGAKQAAGGGNAWPRAADSLVHMFGCRYCYPPNPDHVRTCPVCGKELDENGYVVARMFRRQGRKHVHVLGCNDCRRPGRS